MLLEAYGFDGRASDLGGRLPLIRETMHLAIILEIQRLESNFTKITDAQFEWSQSISGEIGARADDMMFGGRQRGDAAILFARCVNAIAIMSFVPGGIRFAGHRYIGELPITTAEGEER